MVGLWTHNRGFTSPTKPRCPCPPTLEVLLASCSNDAELSGCVAPIASPVAALWYRGRLPDRRPIAAGDRRARGPRPTQVAAARTSCAAAAVRRGHTRRVGRRARHRRGRAPGRARCGRRRPSPCSAAASTSSIRIATPRCSPRSRAHGGLISEYAPGTPPRAGTVPGAQPDRRGAGRGGAGGRGGLRVGRARSRRGCATELGRRVLAVPGSAGHRRADRDAARRSRWRTRPRSRRALAGDAPAAAPGAARAPRRWWPSCGPAARRPVESGAAPGMRRCRDGAGALLAEAELEGGSCRRPAAR